MDRNQRGPRNDRDARGGGGNNSGGGNRRPDPRRNRRGGRHFDRRRPNRRGGRPSPAASPQDTLLKKYLYLLETHNLARKKYFEYYYRTDHSQRNKLERQFSLTAANLRQFENRLTPEEKKQIKGFLDLYPVDSTYSQNHTLPFEGEKDQLPARPEDPHFLQMQKERPRYNDDREESVGTIDDYKSYKGLT